jgi:hypothetical protein
MVNSQRIDDKRINEEEFEMILDWETQGHLTLITNRAVLFHVRTYRKGLREEPRRVGIYIGSDKIAKEFRAWFWDTFESDQAEAIDIDTYSEWEIPPLVPGAVS